MYIYEIVNCEIEVSTLNKNMKILTVALVVVIIAAGIYVALPKGGNDDKPKETIAIQGSTTVGPIMLAVQEVYEAKHKNITLQITANGSGTGAAAAINGQAQIGMLSRDLTADEVSKGLVATVIGHDGIAVIVNKSQPAIKDLTCEQLAKIYCGKITNWKDVGGTDKKINIISREDGSGTRDGFEHAIKGKVPGWKIITDKQEVNSTSGVMSKVDTTVDSIGYISVGYTGKISSNTSVIKVDGKEPTVQNVLAKIYPIQRDLILATKGKATGATLDLINWILGTEGQNIVEAKGFIKK